MIITKTIVLKENKAGIEGATLTIRIQGLDTPQTAYDLFGKLKREALKDDKQKTL